MYQLTTKKINMTTEEQITIELILAEASAYGLAYEVEATAKLLIEEGRDIVSAYQEAYQDWVK
jgi:hypothetical protein